MTNNINGVMKGHEINYQQIVESIQIGILVTDKDGNIMFLNPRMAEILEYSPEELIGKHLFSFIDEKDIELYKQCQERSKLGIVEQLELELIRKDGNKIINLFETTPIIDKTTKYSGMILAAVDITQRALAQKAKKADEWERIFHSFQDIYYRTDMDGTIEIVSPSINNYGYNFETLIGRNTKDFYPDQEIRKQLLEELINNGKVNDFEVQLLASDGKIMETSLTSHVNYDKYGNPVSIEGSLRDISKRKIIEKNLIALIESAPIGIFIIDKEACILDANPKAEKIFGYSKGELKGMDINLLVPERFRENHQKHHKEFVENPAFRTMEIGLELTGMNKNGDDIPVEIALGYFNEGERTVFLAFVNDISKRKKAQKELQTAREEFVAILAHDLKSPLASILGFTDLLRMILSKEADNKKKLDYIDMIRQSGEMMLNQINNMVGAVKMESGKIFYNFENFSLSDLLKEIKISFSPLSIKASISLDFICSDGLRITADKEKIRQVFQNLVANALRYTPNGGKIGITVSKENMRAKVEVYDTGKGITPEDQKKLFLKFSQAKGEKKGTGLGLFIVKNYLEGHGSEILLESEPGKGTTIRFSLPLEEKAG